MIERLFKRGCVMLVSLSLVSLGAPVVSYAGIIGTQTIVEAGQRDADLAAVRAGLNRAEVRGQLLALGVDPVRIDSRLQSLTDSELADLSQRMEQLPAGGSVLAVVGVVFVVLLILELVGVIDIFKTVGKVR